jgi:hypothetical protein
VAGHRCAVAGPRCPPPRAFSRRGAEAQSPPLPAVAGPRCPPSRAFVVVTGAHPCLRQASLVGRAKTPSRKGDKATEATENTEIQTRPPLPAAAGLTNVR